MRPSLILSIGFVSALALPLGAESTRTLRLELSGDPAKLFSVENLAGRMQVRPTGGTKVSVVATVHAETDALARAMRLNQVVGEQGEPALRVIYPEQRVRYPQGGGWGTSDSKYDGGKRFTVSEHSGPLLYADLTVEVPSSAIDGRFRNVVGNLAAEGLNGHVRLDTASGNVSATRLKGDIKADTGSGDVSASDIAGRFNCDTGSGTCTLQGFEGELLQLDTGSGEIHVSGAKAQTVKADTGSGEIALQLADAREIVADTGSGGVVIDCQCPALTRVKVDTGSGDVTLRVPEGAGFELRADQGSGDLLSGFKDAEAITRRREVVGYRRGNAQTRIDVDTGSGDVRIEPVK